MVPGIQDEKEAPESDDWSVGNSEISGYKDDVIDVTFKKEFALLALLFHGHIPGLEAVRERRRLKVAAGCSERGVDHT